MARKGRKRKLRKRERNGRPLRTGQEHGPDRGTNEMQRWRAATTGDQRLSPDYPLSILLGRGLIDEVQHDAGMRLGRLYWALFGKPFGKALDYQLPRGAGMDGAAELRARAEYEAALAALADLGAVSLILDLAVFLRRGWLVDAVLKGETRHRRHRIRLLRIRDALDALANLPRPRVSREEMDRAREEAVA